MGLDVQPLRTFDVRERHGRRVDETGFSEQSIGTELTTMATSDVIAANMRLLRGLRGLSQLELAQEIAVSRRTIARLEAAEIADPGIDQVKSLADALGVTVEMFTSQRLVSITLAVPEAAKEVLASAKGPRIVERLCEDLPPPPPQSKAAPAKNAAVNHGAAASSAMSPNPALAAKD